MTSTTSVGYIKILCVTSPLNEPSVCVSSVWKEYIGSTVNVTEALKWWKRLHGEKGMSSWGGHNGGKSMWQARDRMNKVLTTNYLQLDFILLVRFSPFLSPAARLDENEGQEVVIKTSKKSLSWFLVLHGIFH